ncbi:ABC transporter ATP-binding protein [Frankia sp. AgB32]|uniref:oligopeptide/dipeptide ABC transporter ATP-binding protein n=1 Tax=Frankia sp. AgB32 TaxID=631119 RepID=UPI00200FFCDF|nr:ABC transporter ATP-binding protein [Frankia sp. AgB32]MCK9897844.1 ABC transporter ATP-binding protein [Frankia sp. AgB32]
MPSPGAGSAGQVEGAANSGPILRVDGVTMRFKVAGNRQLTAVDNVVLEVHAGESVALVGESGSGKSTLARCLVSLLEPTAGVVSLDGRQVSGLRGAARRRVYQDIQLVFQDTNGSLNPRWTVRSILDEPLRAYSDRDPGQRDTRVRELMRQVELDESLLTRRPAELSGGQRQRVGLARALAVEPKVLVLDEPTASLDLSTRGQVLDLIGRIQRETGLACVLISHDLPVVRHIADRVFVMYLGTIVESGPTEEVFRRPVHPYTRALVAAAPVARYRAPRDDYRLRGEIPSAMDLPSGCLLAGRCPSAIPSCFEVRPHLVHIGAIGSGRMAACPVSAAAIASAPVPSAPAR